MINNEYLKTIYKALNFLYKDTCMVGLVIEAQYSEEHRHFHTLEHLHSVIKELYSIVLKYSNEDVYTLPPNMTNEEYHDKDKMLRYLLLTALFHDIVYEPGASDNESKSALEYMEYNSGLIDDTIKHDVVCYLINQTKNHDGTDIMSKIFNVCDFSGLYDRFNIRKYENQIFREFSHFQTKGYKEGRIKFLESIYSKSTPDSLYLLELSKEVSKWKPRVGYFPGSFNPYHLGHDSILNQAKQIFDKVVIVVAQNEDKPERGEVDCKFPEYTEIVYLPSGMLLTDLLMERSEHEVITLIHGCRNSDDFNEKIQRDDYMKFLYRNLKTVVFTPCIKYRYMSSTGVRKIHNINETAAKQFTL